MTGKKQFTSKEAEEVKLTLIKIRQSGRAEQKVLRNELRKIYLFYISDFTTSKKGFTSEDFNSLVGNKTITIVS